MPLKRSMRGARFTTLDDFYEAEVSLPDRIVDYDELTGGEFLRNVKTLGVENFTFYPAARTARMNPKDLEKIDSFVKDFWSEYGWQAYVERRADQEREKDYQDLLDAWDERGNDSGREDSGEDFHEPIPEPKEEIHIPAELSGAFQTSDTVARSSPVLFDREGAVYDSKLSFYHEQNKNLYVKYTGFMDNIVQSRVAGSLKAEVQAARKSIGEIPHPEPLDRFVYEDRTLFLAPATTVYPLLEAYSNLKKWALDQKGWDESEVEIPRAGLLGFLDAYRKASLVTVTQARAQQAGLDASKLIPFGNDRDYLTVGFGVYPGEFRR